MGPKTRERKLDPTLIRPEAVLVESGLAKDLANARSLISCRKDDMGTEVIKMVPSDIKGPGGNLEYFCVTRKKL